MQCTFVVGQQVVCISKNWRCPPQFAGLIPIPWKGSIYTITEIVEDLSIEGGVGLSFSEMPWNPALPSVPRYTYLGFRAVKPTSIAVLERLLVPAPKVNDRTPEAV